jgi:hypothetical protein
MLLLTNGTDAKMNTALALQDIESGALTHVVHADNSRYNAERGLTIRQSFYIYPNDRVIAVDYCDGSYDAYELRGENYETLRALYPMYFKP